MQVAWLVDGIGKCYRVLPDIRGKWWIARKILEPAIRGRGYEVIVDLKTAAGGKVVCNLDDWIPWSVYIFGRYQVECQYANFMLDVAKDCATIFDVGANIGYYTVQLARIASLTGKVYAFEPVSYQFAVLGRNLAINHIDNVATNKKIVSDVSGTEKRVYFPGTHSTGSSSIEIKGESNQYEDVECVTLDRYCTDECLDQIDLIKIDVEGHEMSVLRGAREMLRNKKIKNLFTEINDHALAAAGASSQQIVAFMEQFGYKPFSVASGRIAQYVVGKSESLVYFTL